ncbi:Rho GTPase activating protein [Vanrija albida]|uniref:Rho GTPase activating protein n=1 Tax=Vanrija albida TaxID=181172 RepID=A0ABR3QG34_9TREE
MQFPPEVASMLALADTKESPPINATLSPGPSLGTDLTNSPLSSSSERASPVVDQQQQVVAEPHQLSEELMSSSPRPSQDTVISRPSIAMHPESRPSIDSAVNATTYQQAPAAAAAADHTLFNAALLPHTHLSIPHSTVFANQHGRDILCFIISVNVRPPNSAPPLSWTVGKTFSGFMDLDQRLQERAGKTRKEWKKIVSPLPEGKAWKDFAPSKVDQRKHALEVYLESLLVAPISDKTDLCNFLTTDTVQAKAAKSRKEGFLAKKGKTPFGWKTRYFVLDGSLMKYYESRGGPLLGSIVITGAQIGRQYRSQDSSDDRNSRHAFLIIEAARKDSSQARHVLCASSDAERDSWIDMLVQQVDPEPVQSASQAAAAARRRSAMPRKPSKDVVVTSAQPMSLYPDANAKFISGAPLPSVINHMESQRQLHCSGQQASTSPPGQPGTSPQPSHPLGLVSNPAASSSDLVGPLPSAAEPTPKPIKRSSALPGRQSFSPAYLTKLSNDGVGSVPGYNVERDRDRKAKSGRFWGFGKPAEKTASKPVFGVPLTDSIAIASVAGLPAIVFRCIEYLEAKHADQEEGIYRLSGSSAVIKGLKDRFNQEGDVNLLAIDERWDPHAIAGLLKTYLRELPTSLLTRELHMRFLAVIDLIDPAARVTELFRLVAELPPANYALLRAFTAHLILIVRNSAVNKMTLRNIGIVFSPTLGIPAGIFYELVSRFGAIFDDDAGADDLPLDDPAITGTVATSVEGGVAASPASSDAHADLAPPVTGKGKRNSMLYHASGAEAMLGLAGRTLDPAAEDDTSELSIDDLESEPVSVQSSDNLSTLATQPSQADGANAAPAGTRRQAAYGTPSPNDGVEALQPSAQLAAPLQMGRNGSIGNGTM